MEPIIESLAQYGPLGLWTASLLWMNWQMRKDMKTNEIAAKETLQFHQEKIADALKEQHFMIEKSIEKIDQGLDAMKEKYAEDRMIRMKGLSK